MKNFPISVLDKKSQLLVNKYANSTTGLGFVTFQQEVTAITNGAERTSVRTTRLRGDYEELLKKYTKAGTPKEGTIVKFESFEPFWEGQAFKINPQTDAPVLKNGKPVYMIYQFESNPNAKDEWIESEVEETVSVSDDLAKQ